MPKVNLSDFDEVYLIDGHSIDGTQDYYKKLGILVYEQEIKGLGGATFEARKRCATEAMVFFHPDGNVDHKDLSKFRRYFEEGADLVIPSRMIKGAYNEEDDKVIKLRKWANIVFVGVANLLWGSQNCRISDPTNGFRGITVKAYDKLKLDAADLTIDYQMVIRALKAKLRVAEFPTKEGKRLHGETKFRSLPTGLAELRTILREVMIGRNF